MPDPETSSLDTRVRLHIYRTFIDHGAPPSTRDTAEALGLTEPEAAESYRRLAEGRVIVLEPGSTDIWMANPLSARPTPFRVTAADGRAWHGVCVWDSPGILAMLGTDGSIETPCPDCDERLEMTVENGTLRAPEGTIAHFLVPARKWWEDIGFT